MRRLAAARILGMIAVALPLASGCSTSARRQLADSRQRIETLQAQADQLRDEAVTLRNRNRDLAQRAVDDARKLRDIELANARLERAIASYQDERKQVTEAFHQLQQQVYRQAVADDPTPQASLDLDTRPGPSDAAAIAQAASPANNPSESAQAEPLDPSRFIAFARAQAGTSFDPDTNTWKVPPERLFKPGSVELDPGARLLLDAFARLAADRTDPSSPSRIRYVPASDPDVRQTAAAEPSVVVEPAPELARQRAEALRDELARRLKLHPNAITIDPEPVHPNARLAIELRADP